MNPPDPSDLELVRRAATDAAAFGQLYDRYFDQIYAYAASRLRHREEAEDVTSEIWLKALRSLSSFRPKRPESVIAWLFAIARNCVTDAFRRNRPLHSLDLEEVTSLTSDDEHPADTLTRRQNFLEIAAWLEQLPRQQAHCLRLRFYGGLKNTEIAELERIGEKTVAAHVSRGLQTLRNRSLSPSAHDSL